MSQAAEACAAKACAAQMLSSGSDYVDNKVWVQGILTSVRADKDVEWYTIDDGTGIVTAKLTATARMRVMTPGEDYAPGSYLLIMGKVKAHNRFGHIILLHTVIDLSSDPDREAIWIMQVIEAHKAAAGGGILGRKSVEP
mmetsp:Transcript_23094/g.59187  ORF Transcript_23094/g.59187 Transcript_23094/m.59187 type:complete len:140 (-) Transcript_23094:62-481(-)